MWVDHLNLLDHLVWTYAFLVMLDRMLYYSMACFLSDHGTNQVLVFRFRSVCRVLGI